ncbi:MAG: vitamin K epoxide reductase family protein [Anaerolineales bacterium]|nr:vitamin K epoxide reductase family protein [Anaerolineales bacterium]
MDKGFKWVSIMAAILGVLDAAYLFVLKLTSITALCLNSGDCVTINASRYSEIFGIPVSLLGLLAYLAIIGIHALETRSRFFEQNGNLLVFGLSLAGVVFSAYLTYIELYVIDAVCPFCVASAIFITIIFVLSIVRLMGQTEL